MAMYQVNSPGPKLATLDPIWERIRSEAEDIVRREPELASFIYSTVLHHERLEDAVVHRLAERLDHQALSGDLIRQTYSEALRDDPDLADIVPRLLDEANSIAQSCFPEVRRVTRTGPAPDHKPSILQDYELGRAMEIDVLIRAPAAFARAAGLSTPTLDMMAALAIRQAREKGLYRG